MVQNFVAFALWIPLDFELVNDIIAYDEYANSGKTLRIVSFKNVFSLFVQHTYNKFITDKVVWTERNN